MTYVREPETPERRSWYVASTPCWPIASPGRGRIRVDGVRLRARGDLLGRRLAELAEEMRGDGALRVDAALGLLDDELGMLERARLHGAHLGDREVLLEDDGHEVVVRAVALDAALQVVERAG